MWKVAWRGVIAVYSVWKSGHVTGNTYAYIYIVTVCAYYTSTHAHHVPTHTSSSLDVGVVVTSQGTSRVDHHRKQVVHIHPLGSRPEGDATCVSTPVHLSWTKLFPTSPIPSPIQHFNKIPTTSPFFLDPHIFQCLSNFILLLLWPAHLVGGLSCCHEGCTSGVTIIIQLASSRRSGDTNYEQA